MFWPPKELRIPAAVKHEQRDRDVRKMVLSEDVLGLPLMEHFLDARQGQST